MRQKGFTLLEIMIAVTIMTFITIFTARMIGQGVQAKVKIQGEIDRTAGLKGALSLMTQDLQEGFNYHDINIELFNAAQQQRQGTAAAPPSPGVSPAPVLPVTTAGAPGAAPGAGNYEQKTEKTFSRFIGETDKLNFTSLNNYRNRKNMQESDQAEIGYYLDTCSSRIKKDQSGTCLWRRVSPYIDDDIKEGGTKTPILENVKSMKFRYLGIGHEEEWIDKWDSEQGEEVMKTNFPYAVEITLTVLDKRTDPAKEIPMTAVAALRFPNNKPSGTPNATTNTAN
jgi:prepilin-type N-terminal cleavage/methylation domain-containing protein